MLHFFNGKAIVSERQWVVFPCLAWRHNG